VPHLIEALKDKDARVRAPAAIAFGAIGADAKAAVPVLIAALSTDPNNDVRRLAADSLGLIGPDAKEAVPALLKALHADSRALRDSAAEALKRIDPRAAERAGLR
jgi:HEAT repeat protein